MFRSCLSSLVLAVVILFLLMSLPLALSEARTPPVSPTPAPERGKTYTAYLPIVTRAAETAVTSPAPPSTISLLGRRPRTRRLRTREAFLLGAVFMSAFAIIIRGGG